MDNFTRKGPVRQLLDTTIRHVKEESFCFAIEKPVGCAQQLSIFENHLDDMLVAVHLRTKLGITM